MKKLVICIVLAVLLMLCATPAYANGIPKLPHTFYGSVTINNASAPDGTQVSATVNIGDIISTQNPVTTAGGSYGINSPYLLVQGYDIPPDATITFYVTNENGTAICGTDTFEAVGGPTKCDLIVTIAAPPRPSVGGGTRRVEPLTIDTNLFGVEWSFRISDDGEILAAIEATSEDGNLTITIPKGTIALDKYGNPLDSLEVAVDESPPKPPEDAYIIGLAYNFSPDGATFDPAITFVWSYTHYILPTGVAEKDLVIAYYDEGKDEWVEVDCVVDTENNTITASVSHFTTFAIIGAVTPPAPAAFSLSNLTIQPIEVQPREAVTITASVANTGGTVGSYAVVLKINGVEEAEKSVTVAAGSSEIVTFSVTREEPGSYSVTVDGLSASFTIAAPAPPPPVKPEVVPPEVKPPINWPLIAYIIVAVVAVGLLIFFFVVRRKGYLTK